MRHPPLATAFLALGVLAGAPPRAGAQQVVHVPIRVLDGFIVAKGEIDGRSGVLLLDTGASMTVINTRHASQQPAQAPGRESPTAMDGTGSLVAQQLCQAGNLRFGELALGAVNAACVDLGGMEAMLASALATFDSTGTPQPLLGILGRPELERFLTVFDYKAQEITLYRLNAAGVPLQKPSAAADSIPIVVNSYYIGIHADVGGQPVALALDTGAQEMMLDSVTAQRLGSHLTLLPRVPGEGYTSISGQFVPVVRGTLDRLTLGAATYDSLPVLVGQQNLLGGTALLARRPFALNLRKPMLYLWKER